MSGFRAIQGCQAPLFRQDRDGKALFYAPGYLALVDASQADIFEGELRRPDGIRSPAATELYRHAVAAQRARQQIMDRPFKPLCLTLYLHNACNLACAYCYSSPDAIPQTTPRLELAAIRAGAELVAQNCAAANRAGANHPLTAVFHGGGEPTLDLRQVDDALDAIEAIAADYELTPFRYVATNGILSEAKARWLARRFDLVGLSCDGPPDIQSRQRPLSRRSSIQPSTILERTARILREEGRTFHVRATVTPESYPRQAEIAAYICQRLGPQEIHVEPVYQGGRGGAQSGFQPEQAADYVANYLRAREIAKAYGVPWLTSASRPGEIHGPYCQVARQVLHLLPGGVSTACFKTVTADQARQLGLAIGHAEPETGRFALDGRAIQRLQEHYRCLPPGCQDCFNAYHCTLGCPDGCILVDPLEEFSPGAEFRCRVQKLLVEAYLWEIARSLEAVQPARVAYLAITGV